MVQAGNDFFNTDASHPPQRVDGPPFDTATQARNGTSTDTVSWYMGDNATDDPRSTAQARVDTSQTVSYGSRANEDFQSRYRQMFGPNAAPIGSLGQSSYEGLRFLEAVASKAGSLAMGPMLAAGRNIDYGGARGPVVVRNGHARMQMYLAEADGLDFKLIKPI